MGEQWLIKTFCSLSSTLISQASLITSGALKACEWDTVSENIISATKMQNNYGALSIRSFDSWIHLCFASHTVVALPTIAQQ